MFDPTLISGYLVLLFVLASLPWINARAFGLILLREGRKPFWMRGLEWIVLFGVGLAVGLFIEGRASDPQAQDWEFYATLLFVFVVFALPGFIWQYQLRKVLVRH